MIVVDIQGVGDLYTDPQIHTARADEYGDANLGMFLLLLILISNSWSNIVKLFTNILCNDIASRQEENREYTQTIEYFLSWNIAFAFPL